MQTATTPQIYVACLASYNAGKLHGEWIDLNDGPLSETFLGRDIQKVLDSSPEPRAEEWAVHDYNDFPNLGEHPSVSDLAKVAELIGQYGDAFKAALDYAGGNIEHATNMIEDCFRGQFDTLRDFAEQKAESLEVYDHPLGQYFDVNRYAADLECQYNVIKHDGSVYVFDYC